MKHINKITLAFVLIIAVVTSCVDNSILEYEVKKPASIADMEYLNAYNALKTYIDRSANPNFKLGAGVSVSDYNAQGLVYRLISSNFDEITAGYEMKHGAVVQADGSLNLGNVSAFVETADKAGISVFGHTLCWHANQNAKYLNGLIAPTVIPGAGGPTWDAFYDQNFETDDASNYSFSTNGEHSFTAVGEGFEGKGRALKIVNTEERANDWDVQLFVTFPQPVAQGDRILLTMDIKSDATASYSTQAHTAPGAYKHWDFFGSLTSTPEWTTYTKEITVSGDQATANTIAFNLGKTATTYYFDNIKVTKYNESGGGGPALDPSVIANSDFETGDAGWVGWGNGSTRGRSANGEGYGGGYCYYMTNPSTTNFWEAQTAYDLSPVLKMNGSYTLKMKVKGSIAGNIRAEVQSSADYSSDGFGAFAVTTDWTSIELSTVMGKEDRNRFVISFGDYAGTIYIDDVTLQYLNPNGGGEQIIEKTPEEKRQILTESLEAWISGMMAASKTVKAWDIVNEPMSDWPDQYQLKTGIGKTDMAADEFYWQDYLGKDYAVTAIQIARRQEGHESDKLFINDYGLESSLDKCKGLIEYVKYVESKGVTVDGIGTQMHVSLNLADRDKIAEHFRLLAATGKLIKISELDMGIEVDGKGIKTDEATDEQLRAQADLYKYIVKTYFEIIPATQRYGITQWAATDSPASSSWRGGEPIGLWTLDYDRKHAYAGFADGLSGAK